LIAIDWGTSSFRAYRLSAEGALLDKRSAPLGILQVQASRFAEALGSQIADWLGAGEAPVVMSGMIGSRQGWQEVPYVSCPAGVAQLAAGMREVRWDSHRAWIAPGLSSRDASGVPDVMRGEETQLAGILDQLPPSACVCLPGTHSKWVEVRAGKILHFSTYMTGETFAVLKEHSILGRMMSEAPTDLSWFDAGVRRAQDPGGLLHHVFGVRARGLFGELADVASASYLSGILVGHELTSARTDAGLVHLLGAPHLVAIYARALNLLGGDVVTLDPDAAVHGLLSLARHLPRR
jgi:2-dehydro-3-deoxygalactonokinase